MVSGRKIAITGETVGFGRTAARRLLSGHTFQDAMILRFLQLPGSGERPKQLGLPR